MSVERSAEQGPADRAAFEPELEFVMAPEPDREPRTHTIHLLDQDSGLLLALFDLLSQAGYQVSASSNPADALVFVARNSSELLIAGCELRDITTGELLEQMKYACPSLRIILMGEVTELVRYHAYFPGGRVSAVPKPVRDEAILEAVRRILGP